MFTFITKDKRIFFFALEKVWAKGHCQNGWNWKGFQTLEQTECLIRHPVASLLHIITHVTNAPATNRLEMLTVCWSLVELISMIECHIDNCTVIGPHLAHFSQGHSRLELIPERIGWEAGKYPGHLASPSGRTYTLSFTYGQFSLQSTWFGVWEETERFGGNPWKHEEKHEIFYIWFLHNFNNNPIGNFSRSFDVNEHWHYSVLEEHVWLLTG